MTKKLNKGELKRYEGACELLAKAFLYDLYDEEENPDCYWIGDAVGGMFCFGDWIVSMDNIADYFRYDYTSDEFFDWYSYQEEEHLKGKSPVNMKNWKKLT